MRLVGLSDFGARCGGQTETRTAGTWEQLDNINPDVHVRNALGSCERERSPESAVVYDPIAILSKWSILISVST